MSNRMHGSPLVSIRVQSVDCELEGVLLAVNGTKGVVIAHPHPLYGGDMHNPVVKTLADAYAQCGYAALRFNFRGVGASSGRYDGGAGEASDVAAMVAYLADRGYSKIALAGYSFGAWVNAHMGPHKLSLDHQVMVAPPIGMLDFDRIHTLPELKLVVAGGRDPFGDCKMVASLANRWAPHARVDIIEDADHFFVGHLNPLRQSLTVALTEA